VFKNHTISKFQKPHRKQSVIPQKAGLFRRLGGEFIALQPDQCIFLSIYVFSPEEPSEDCLSLLFLTMITACKGTQEENQRSCNGHALLCERAVDEVAFPATHNSMSSQEEEWIPPNHLYAVPQQLADGVRSLNLDTYMWQDEASLCHGYCELGSKALAETLREISVFLETSPDNVILITFQAGIGAEETLYAFEEAGLRERMHHKEHGMPWPTLEELITANEQLVVFASNGGGEDSGYMAQWDHWLDSPYSAQQTEDFACLPDRGEESTASLYNVNHFLTAPIALEANAQIANESPMMQEHVSDCYNETGLFPNQVLVDFYSIGDLFGVVRQLNGLK
jgi:hypothetical protein